MLVNGKISYSELEQLVFQIKGKVENSYLKKIFHFEGLWLFKCGFRFSNSEVKKLENSWLIICLYEIFFLSLLYNKKRYKYENNRKYIIRNSEDNGL